MLKRNKEYIFYDDTDVSAQYKEAKIALYDMYQEDYDWYSAEEVPEDMIWREVNMQNDDDLHFFKHDLARIFNGKKCLIKGTTGRWNGRFDCGRFISSVDQLFSELSYLNNLKCYEINGHFYIEGSHHDGNDYFELKLLTKKGESFAESNCFAHDRQLHSTIFDNNFYSAIPHLYERLYGAANG